MKRHILMVLMLVVAGMACGEDGSRLWLRYDVVNKAKVTGPECVAAEELRKYYPGTEVSLVIDPAVDDDEGYIISGTTIKAKTQQGLLYGAYALLRGENGASKPFFRLRILNHWDNLDSSIERGYAGLSIFGEAFTLFSTAPLMPIEALARAYSLMSSRLMGMGFHWSGVRLVLGSSKAQKMLSPA